MKGKEGDFCGLRRNISTSFMLDALALAGCIINPDEFGVS